MTFLEPMRYYIRCCIEREGILAVLIRSCLVPLDGVGRDRIVILSCPVLVNQHRILKLKGLMFYTGFIIVYRMHVTGHDKTRFNRIWSCFTPSFGLQRNHVLSR